MENATIYVLLKALARVIWPTIRKLRAERRAAHFPASIRPNYDSLDQQLEAALTRLGSINENLEFWRRLLADIGATYTRPLYFNSSQIREWLSDAQVKVALKNLARNRLIGKKINNSNSTLNLIREKYTEITGIDVYGATYAIAVVLAVLHASVRASLSSGENVVVDIIKDTHADSIEKFSEQSHAIEGVKDELRRFLPLEDALHGEVLREELARIVQRRAIPGVNSGEEIKKLLGKIKDEGRLCRAPSSEKAEIYYWAARIFVTNKETVDQAKNCLRLYEETPHVDSQKVAFIKAWLSEAEGRTQGAINILSDLDCADARTSILALLAKRDGNSAALDWLAQSDSGTHTLLTPVGWRNAAAIMIEEGHWESALNLLKQLPEQVFESFPDLFFVKGMLHASFLLPEPVRPRFLRQAHCDFKAEVQEGEEATRHRVQAVQALRRARHFLLELGAEERTHGCEYHVMWIRLTDPQERDAAFSELTEKMKDEKYALFLLEIALNFDASFDQEQFRRCLRRRELEGRQDAHDVIANFLLLRRYGTPSDVLSYLKEKTNKLKETLGPVGLASAKIQALIKNGQVADAEKELEECSDIFPEDDFERHRLIVADRKGEDLREIERLYKRTNQYDDLFNLVRYLERTHQWAALLPYAKKILETRRAAVHLLSLIRAMHQTGSSAQDIISCLDEYKDLVIPRTPPGDELLLFKAFALFGLGMFTEAEQIAHDLAVNCHDPNAISLEINVAMRTGQWEHFTAIADREFPRLKELPPRVLLQMASVVADRDQDRAMRITGVAAEKEPENGETQAYVYWLASQIGRECDAEISFERATRLAQQGEGPFRLFQLREVVETMRAHAQRRREWEQQYHTGEMGLHQICGLLNIPMAQILVGALFRNEKETDPRRRSVMPIRHGGRSLVELSETNSMAFDLSSLLVLESLGILEVTFDTLERVYLSPRLMDVLFVEHRQVRFHQPSRVEKAKRILKLMDEGAIQLLQEVQPSHELVGEVGPEMATLLQMARNNGGRVLSTLPIHRAESLGEEAADLREFGPLVLKTTQFLQHMKPHIAPETYASAQGFLASVDRGEPLGENGLGTGSLYIDDLALEYLDTASLLQYLKRLGCDCFVAESVKVDKKQLVDAAEQGDEIADVIDRLRKRIRDGVQSGKVRFLSESSDREKRQIIRPIDVLLDLFETTGSADAICLDDRTFGKYGTDEHGRRVIGSIEVLEYLSARSAITEEKKRSCYFRLRKGGMAFLPVDADFLLAALRDAIDRSQNQFVESSDLVAIRENFQRIRSMKLLRVPEDDEWLSQMIYAARQILDKIWGDSTIAIEMAEKISDWVFDVLAPLPVDWRESIVQVNEENIAELTESVLLLFLNRSTTFTDATRMQAYAIWAEQRLIRPLLQANASLVDEVSKRIQPVVSKFAKEVANGSN